MEGPPVDDEALPPHLFAQAAQEIYNDHERAQKKADDLYGAFTTHYRSADIRGEEYLVDRARYRELRGPWNALLAPILHGIEVEIVKETLPFIRAGAPLAPASITGQGDMDHMFGQNYEGESLSAMRAITQWSTAVAEWFFEEVRTDSGHWCRPIIDPLRCITRYFVSLNRPRRMAGRANLILLTRSLRCQLTRARQLLLP